jgi:formylglycine-generating enzyme required for sulfatase activity
VRIEVNDPAARVTFDKDGPTITGADKQPITLEAGEHGIAVTRGDFTFETDKLVLKRGAAVTLKVTFLDGKVQIAADGKLLAEKELPLAKAFTNRLGMELVLVPRGRAWLGGGKDRPGDREVEIRDDFYLGKYEVTQEELQKVMGENPCHFSRGGQDKDWVKDVPDADLKRFPVEWVSWGYSQVFCERLNQAARETGWTYRLPREAEWEYACRGGPMADKSASAFDYYLEKGTDLLAPEQARFNHGQPLTGPCKVGSYRPNALGLYDMHGNVREWCEDKLDPKDAREDALRVHRGGGWGSPADGCRTVDREGMPPWKMDNRIGLRVARVPTGK